ncbi:MAG: response regulator [Spirochaetaceae bacterium]|nr:response regulator [Spirochaetaceae bacterium]
MKWSLVLKKNFQQFFFVVAAFAIMVLVSTYCAGFIVRRQHSNGVAEVLRTVESNIQSNLRAPEIALVNAKFAIEELINRGATQVEVLNFITNLTDLLIARDTRMTGFISLYGFIRGEFVDGTRWLPPADYVAEAQPWYEAARGRKGGIGVTMPYIEPRDQRAVAAWSVELFDARGEFLGIIATTIDITEVTANVPAIQLSRDGYGFLLNQNFEIIAHPIPSAINRRMSTVSAGYAEVEAELETRDEVYAKKVLSVNGIPAMAFFRRMYNGWIVGIISPLQSYNRDVYLMSVVLALLGTVLVVILCWILLRLIAARMQSDEDSRHKSSFLARMSHEIRTPMNAVIGMSELALQTDNQAKMVEYLDGIKQAGINLLAIINDILDFSKIETGNLRISSVSYTLASLINDVINVARVRIAEKSLFFIVNVDSAIPNNLFGDEVRIRQILLNLLSNAAKYTRQGYIRLTVRKTPGAQNSMGALRALPEKNEVVLSFEVADTGIGLKPEDLQKLFAEFVRVDMDRNRGIEGTGLGLTISRSFCRAMGGDIMVSSVYGKGSVFTAIIPQQVSEKHPIAAVENPDQKKTLIYHGQSLYGESLFTTLENLQVPVSISGDRATFFREILSGRYAFAFVSASLASETLDRIREQGLKTKIVLIAGLGESAAFKDIPAVIMPTYAVPVANILNGLMETERQNKKDVHFIAPSARILVVDDIVTNLKVAEGLLALYRVIVKTCTSGAEAIEFVKNQHFDMILLDHMMPDMDGIETAAAIRTMENGAFKDLPIVALTANAISGMREMFLERGFNDYLAKPIETTKLGEILHRWIPKEKWSATADSGEKAAASAPSLGPSLYIEGLDVNQGISMTGGSEEGYREVLLLYYRDVIKRLDILKNVPGPEELPLFTTQVHALKSASASIGAAGIAERAAALEGAGKAGDLQSIQQNLDGFRNTLSALAEAIREALPGSISAAGTAQPTSGTGAGASASASAPASTGAPPAVLLRLREALAAENIREIDIIIEELGRMVLDEKTREIVSLIADHILVSAFKEADDLIGDLLKDNSQDIKETEI